MFFVVLFCRCFSVLAILKLWTCVNTPATLNEGKTRCYCLPEIEGEALSRSTVVFPSAKFGLPGASEERISPSHSSHKDRPVTRARLRSIMDEIPCSQWENQIHMLLFQKPGAKDPTCYYPLDARNQLAFNLKKHSSCPFAISNKFARVENLSAPGSGREVCSRTPSHLLNLRGNKVTQGPTLLCCHGRLDLGVVRYGIPNNFSHTFVIPNLSVYKIYISLPY
ncbi:unnamed protein product [Cuscuta europaea]|uniref:Uncharacterized protein n=1 Tax=Cuscuta europaea TaxID=41803 RepID=A0A9P0Z936_CUSEU|nr:unnamed protein product [Cuscuta europaea]